MKRPTVLLALAALALAGCGFGAGADTGPVTVVVTQDFGDTHVQTKSANAHADETVMQMLQGMFTVTTRYGGGFVQEIDGLSGGKENGARTDWFYYVNGVQAAKSAASTPARDGDTVWWDHHDWTATQNIPAVVGSYPEPFTSGIDGKLLPIRMVCMDAGSSCDEVQQRLNNEDVEGIARSSLEQSVGEVLRILVGPWSQVRKDVAAQQLEHGPKASGVYAIPNRAGTQIKLLDQDGRVQRTLGPGGGLVAATGYPNQQPTWLITGTDAAGVAAAAAALNEGELHDRFAVAVDEGRGVGLPIVTP